MTVAVDATSLAFLVNPDAGTSIDPETNLPVPRVADRVRLLISDISKSKGRVIIPAPALAEVLVKAEDGGAELINILHNASVFLVAPFDQMAAIELAAMTRDALAAGGKKGGHSGEWQKVKLDRQICAIAKLHRAERFYTDDENLAKFARKVGMAVFGTKDLPLPLEPERDLFS
ncbi:MAG: hypothetical protein V4523_07990 [Pseudomonadota bacterium]